MEQLNIMKKMKASNFKMFISIVFYILICLLAYSKGVKSLSEIKLKGVSNGVQKKMEINGYYKKKGKNSMHESFLFYDDGTIVLNNRIPGDTCSYGGGWWPPGSFFNTDLYRWDFGADGVYEEKNDTIYANLYFENCFGFSDHFRIYFQTYLYKLKFVIINRVNIVWYEQHEIDNPIPEMINDTLQFIPAASELPPPYTRLKYKKQWLWENKKDWKNYKKCVKQLRKTRNMKDHGVLDHDSCDYFPSK